MHPYHQGAPKSVSSQSLQALLEDLGYIEGIEFPMKATSFHITLDGISVKESELEHVMATSRFLDHIITSY